MSDFSEEAITTFAAGADWAGLLDGETTPAPAVDATQDPSPEEWERVNFARHRIELVFQDQLTTHGSEFLQGYDASTRDLTLQLAALGVAVDSLRVLHTLQLGLSVADSLVSMHTQGCPVEIAMGGHVRTHVAWAFMEFAFMLRSRFEVLGAPPVHAPAEGEQAPGNLEAQ